MNITRDVKFTALNMAVIARGGGAIYLRLPVRFQRRCGNCSCPYCKAHPDQKPMWDTLAVAVYSDKRSDDWSWTVHMPDPVAFKVALEEVGEEK